MILLDTNVLVYAYDPAEPGKQARALDVLDRLVRAGAGAVSAQVLAEFVALCNTRRVSRHLALDLVERLVREPDVHVWWVTQDDHDRALQLLRARPDKTYSLCDAVSFELMRRQAISDALTTDHHFEQEGFTRLLRD